MNKEIHATNALASAFAYPLDQAKRIGRVAIYGAGPLGRFLAHLCAERGIQVVCFIDDYAEVSSVDGTPRLPRDEALRRVRPEGILLATVESMLRMSIALENAGYTGRVLRIDPINLTIRSRTHELTPEQEAKIESYHNKHFGHRAFLVCNGPSLLETDPRLLKNEITFASNSIFLLEGFTPTYYSVVDPHLIRQRAKEINALAWTKFVQASDASLLTNGIQVRSLWSKSANAFSTDLASHMIHSATVTYSMLQILFYMGCSPVYIIGADHTYDTGHHIAVPHETRTLRAVNADTNHFHPDYFAKGTIWTAPQYERIEAAYRTARQVYELYGRNIFNATEGGRLDIYDRVDFESLL